MSKEEEKEMICSTSINEGPENDQESTRKQKEKGYQKKMNISAVADKQSKEKGQQHNLYYNQSSLLKLSQKNLESAPGVNLSECDNIENETAELSISEKGLLYDVEKRLKSQLQRSNLQIDKLVPLETLGKGGQGEVQKYLDPISKKYYAKKTVYCKTDAITFKKMAMKEIKILKQLIEADNSKLLAIYDVQFNPGNSFNILMEYGRGTLATYNAFRKEKNEFWLESEL